ncbi:hypothetical protein DSO57_1010126 [Entomophthora muscae]|uniref:Uncharacterized protein n=1 Tax=Entomophthora muscae TaxID=34485 RepID=A0ACC2SVH7_9FUNG|nr:hypothetical protein DSO57_1010126 [Entomophthora muscae]
MKAPPTPKPNCLQPTPGLTPPSANHYAGISYITLAELVDTMVTAVGPWALHPSYGGLYPPPNRANWQRRLTGLPLGRGIQTPTNFLPGLIPCLLHYCLFIK